MFFFLHCNFRLTSWDYFIATGAIYFACILWALANAYFKFGISTKASISLESPDSLRVEIATTSSWQPGQHAYLRFLTGGIHALTTHPLTICSMSSKREQDNEMVFYVHPRGGMTRRLAEMARKQPESRVRVLVEGPYGGLPRRWSEGSDQTLLIAGGSGTAFTLSLIEDWLSQGIRVPPCTLKVVLATRDPEFRVWYIEELQRMSERQCGAGLTEVSGLSIHIHETCDPAMIKRSQPRALEEVSTSDDEKVHQSEAMTRLSASSSLSLFGVRFFRGRPDTAAAVKSACMQGQADTVGVVVCGPSGMVHDVSCEAAAQQQRILRGRAGPSEVWFHKEAFS